MRGLIIKQILRASTTKFIAIVFILIISLIFCEIGLRIFNHFSPTYVFYDTSYSRFRPKPFSENFGFKVNSKGFNDLEYSKKKGDDYRLLGIGDSFSFGSVPYEYNYLTLLEYLLKKEYKKIEVLNMGIAGIGPKDYLSLLIKEGVELNPDMILLSFFIGNDFVESNRNVKRKLHTYSYVASLIYYMLDLKPKVNKIKYFKYDKYCDDCPAFDRFTHMGIGSSKIPMFFKRNENFIKMLDDAIYYITLIRDLCIEENIKLFVIIIPDELQFDHSFRNEVLQYFYPLVNKRHFDLTLPNTMLSKKLTGLSIDHIDLYKYFAEVSKGQRLYKPTDTHWNIAGNQLAASIIQIYLSKYLKNKADIN
jgi:hypothetical protein